MALLPVLIAPCGGHQKAHPEGEFASYRAAAAVGTILAVSANGSSSVFYDAVEAAALASLFGARLAGVPVHSVKSMLGQTGVERFAYEQDIRDGAVRLVFVSPERLVNSDLFRIFQKAGVRTFAIDEAHCISHWGHDFRPEYRQLNRLREFFPDATFHSCTTYLLLSASSGIPSPVASQAPSGENVMLEKYKGAAAVSFRFSSPVCSSLSRP